jgi:DNA ligase (NAD+)
MDEPQAQSCVRDLPLAFEPPVNLDDETAERRLEQLREAVWYHDHRYYQLADPVVSDRTYDALFDRLETLEAALDRHFEPSPTPRVGREPLEQLETVAPLEPLLSIDSPVARRKRC